MLLQMAIFHSFSWPSNITLCTSWMAQWVKNPPTMQQMQEMQVRSLGWEDPLEEEMATHSSILFFFEQ